MQGNRKGLPLRNRYRYNYLSMLRFILFCTATARDCPYAIFDLFRRKYVVNAAFLFIMLGNRIVTLRDYEFPLLSLKYLYLEQ